MNDFLKGTVTQKDWMAVAGMLGATAVFVLGFFFLVNHPQKSNLTQLTSQSDQVYADLVKARDIDAKISSLREETESIEMLVGEFEERLPSRREIPTLLKEFEAMAAEEDIEVELSPLDRNRDDNKEIIPFQIVAHGQFHQVASFINQLERFKRYLKISDLHVEPAKEGISTARFTLNTYRFIQHNPGDQS
jgi:Tfp pilus assembly protein PilO